jgi:hypothetical protein
MTFNFPYIEHPDAYNKVSKNIIMIEEEIKYEL